MNTTPPQPDDTSGAELANARTIGEALALAEGWLRAVPDSESAALDAQLLLAHVTALARIEPRLATVYATDVSADALSLARENAQRIRVAERIHFLEGDLLLPLPEPVDVLLANLPYVALRDAPTLADDVRRYEPSLALYGDDDGLGYLRRLFA